jgi:hypothetical protein
VWRLERGKRTARRTQRVDARFRNPKGSWRRVFVRERQEGPYIPVFQIDLRFNAVSSVASRRSVPDTEIPAQVQRCSERIGCSGEKCITSPSNLSTRKAVVRVWMRPERRSRGSARVARAECEGPSPGARALGLAPDPSTMFRRWCPRRSFEHSFALDIPGTAFFREGDEFRCSEGVI